MNRLILFSYVLAAVGPGYGQTGFTLAPGIQGGNWSCYGAACQLDEGFGNRVIKGKPFSATEERHSLQVLGDGTRIENSETNRLYRDGDGRTRAEQMNGTVTIYDPVANLRVELDPATKTARKNPRNFVYFNNSNTVTFNGQ